MRAMAPIRATHSCAGLRVPRSSLGLKHERDFRAALDPWPALRPVRGTGRSFSMKQTQSTPPSGARLLAGWHPYERHKI